MSSPSQLLHVHDPALLTSHAPAWPTCVCLASECRLPFLLHLQLLLGSCTLICTLQASALAELAQASAPQSVPSEAQLNASSHPQLIHLNNEIKVVEQEIKQVKLQLSVNSTDALLNADFTRLIAKETELLRQRGNLGLTVTAPATAEAMVY